MHFGNALGTGLKRWYGGSGSVSAFSDLQHVADLAQATANNQPVLDFTTLPSAALAYSFNPSGVANPDWMTVAGAGPSAAVSNTLMACLFMVPSGYAFSGTHGVIAQIGAGGAGCILFYNASTNELLFAGEAGVGLAFSNAGFVVGDSTIHTGIGTVTASGSARLWIDGVQQAGTSGTLSAAGVNLSSSEIRIGATDAAGTLPMQGLLASLGIAQKSSAFTAAEIANVHAALLEYKNGTPYAASSRRQGPRLAKQLIRRLRTFKPAADPPPPYVLRNKGPRFARPFIRPKAYAQAPVAGALADVYGADLAYWWFEDFNGATWGDDVGTNDLTVGASAPSAGTTPALRVALDFDSSTLDTASSGTGETVPVGTVAAQYCGDFKFTSTGSLQPILRIKDGIDQRILQFGIDSADQFTVTDDLGAGFFSGVLTADVWHRFVVELRSDNTVSLYIDEAFVASDNIHFNTASLLAATDRFTIGGFWGSLCSVGIAYRSSDFTVDSVAIAASTALETYVHSSLITVTFDGMSTESRGFGITSIASYAASPPAGSVEQSSAALTSLASYTAAPSVGGAEQRTYAPTSLTSYAIAVPGAGTSEEPRAVTLLASYTSSLAMGRADEADFAATSTGLYTAVVPFANEEQRGFALGSLATYAIVLPAAEAAERWASIVVTPGAVTASLAIASTEERAAPLTSLASYILLASTPAAEERGLSLSALSLYTTALPAPRGEEAWTSVAASPGPVTIAFSGTPLEERASSVAVLASYTASLATSLAEQRSMSLTSLATYGVTFPPPSAEERWFGATAVTSLSVLLGCAATESQARSVTSLATYTASLAGVGSTELVPPAQSLSTSVSLLPAGTTSEASGYVTVAPGTVTSALARAIAEEAGYAVLVGTGGALQSVAFSIGGAAEAARSIALVASYQASMPVAPTSEAAAYFITLTSYVALLSPTNSEARAAAITTLASYAAALPSARAEERAAELAATASYVANFARSGSEEQSLPSSSTSSYTAAMASPAAEATGYTLAASASTTSFLSTAGAEERARAVASLATYAVSLACASAEQATTSVALGNYITVALGVASSESRGYELVVIGGGSVEATIRWSARPATFFVVTFKAATAIASAQRIATRITFTMSTEILYVGAVNVIDFEFRDNFTRELVDPDTASILTQLQGSSASTSYTYGVDANVTKLGQGMYRAKIKCTAAGTWDFVIVSPGPTAEGTAPGSFVVKALPFT